MQVYGEGSDSMRWLFMTLRAIDERADLTPAEQELVRGFARVGVTLYVWRTPDEALRTIGAIE